MQKVHTFSYKKNRLNQLKGFYYTARFRSVSEAARVVGLTQSTITLQIQSLEQDLGLKLFKRDTRPMSLTVEGEELYKKTCPIIGEFESVVERFLDYKKDKEKKEIDIAVHHVAISYLMPEIISLFKKSYPQSQIVLRNITPNEAVRRLKDRKIDLGFYPVYDLDPELEYVEVISFDPILIMNKSHPLAKRNISSLKDLKPFDLIRIDKSFVTLPLFEEAMKGYKLSGSIEFENGNWDMLKTLVKKNDFIAIVSSVCISKQDDFVVKNLSKFFPKMNYAIMYKKGVISREVVDGFIESIKTYCKANNDDLNSE